MAVVMAAEEMSKWCDQAPPSRQGSMDEHCEVVPREFLCCRLCKDEYQDPKYLPCLHSFCKACIDDYIDNSSDGDGNFACPVCGTATSLPEDEDRPALPDNTFARRLSCPAVLPEKRFKMCSACFSVGSNVDATIHCMNCDEFLCGACSLQHLEQEETASHRSQSIDEYTNASEATPPAPSENPTLPRCCDCYDALDIGSSFCVDCDLALCADCHASSHREHRCAEISAIAQNFETKIKDPLRHLKKDSNMLQKAVGTMEKARRCITQQKAEVESAVKQRTKVLWNLIQEYEKFLLLEVDQKHKQNLEAIAEKVEALERHIASIKAVTDFTDKLLTFGSEEEKVAMRRKIGHRVRELCEEELPSKHVDLMALRLAEPTVKVESICDMFGELKNEMVGPTNKRRSLSSRYSIDLGVLSHRHHSNQSSVSSIEDLHPELSELDENTESEDADMLSGSNQSDVFRRSSMSLLTVSNSSSGLRPRSSSLRSQEAPDATNSSFNSTVHDDVPCQNLGEPKKEVTLPEVIAKDCVKGVGVTPHGDIVVGTVSGGTSKIFILEKHGIVRGQIPVEKNWNLHSVSADGKISLMVNRGDSRYKIKVMSGDSNERALADTYIETYGFNYVTANRSGTILVTSNRYAQPSTINGKSVKSGGNLAMYNPDGTLHRRITNDSFAKSNMYLFDRPHHVAVDASDNFFVTDPGTHSVLGFKPDGELMFEYGNTDIEEELYQGPDGICADRFGNVIVLDKKDGRIDILNYDGQLLRCFFPSEHVKFMGVMPDQTLLLVTSEGDLKIYDYA